MIVHLLTFFFIYSSVLADDHHTDKPTNYPTKYPTEYPTKYPLEYPTKFPTEHPTEHTTEHPTDKPTHKPTTHPTKRPTEYPTYKTTHKPTAQPTKRPTAHPTAYPTDKHTHKPTNYPTKYPTEHPTGKPILITTHKPTEQPTKRPTYQPTKYPTAYPTEYPTGKPTHKPIYKPTHKPTEHPTEQPTKKTTFKPTYTPTKYPTFKPTAYPTHQPTKYPTKFPIEKPTEQPTKYPTNQPTKYPTKYPTEYPTKIPIEKPTEQPTAYPTHKPTVSPTKYPTPHPTKWETKMPTKYTTTNQPTKYPWSTTKSPTKYPQQTPHPTKWETKYPTKSTTDKPTEYPSKYPTTDKPITGKEIFMRINSYKQHCTGLIDMECMLIQKDDKIGTNEWSIFYDQIDGFEYTEGYIYYLKVNKFNIPSDQIMQDGSSIRYELVKIISKEKPIYKKPSNDDIKRATCVILPNKNEIFGDNIDVHAENNGFIKGTIVFDKVDNDEYPYTETTIKITGTISGLPANSVFGWHIHEFGDIRNNCASAGLHYNPFGVAHGGPNDKIRHVGDLGNIYTDNNGIAKIDILDSVIELNGKNSIIGRSIVIHERKDDFIKQPTGGSMGRLACGVIGIRNIEIDQGNTPNHYDQDYRDMRMPETSIIH